MVTFDDKLIHRFLIKVAIRGEDECWNWKASTDRRGYGQFRYTDPVTHQDTNLRASRVAWELYNREPIPDGILVCHHCDNPACVNPKHLFIGASADNSHDMVCKKRSRFGEKNINAKLTDQDVVSIRTLRKQNHKIREIARMFGVDHRAIQFIIRGVTWKHVTDDAL